MAFQVNAIKLTSGNKLLLCVTTGAVIYIYGTCDKVTFVLLVIKLMLLGYKYI